MFHFERYFPKSIRQYLGYKPYVRINEIPYLSEFFRSSYGVSFEFCLEKGDADSQTPFSGEESETKKIVASIGKQASAEARHSEEEEEANSGIRYHGVNHKDAPATQDNGSESDVTQYSPESSESMQYMERKRDNFAEPENPRRRSTRSKASGTKAS